MPDNESPTRLPVAKIARAHGIKGQVKLTPYTDDISVLETPGALYLSETGQDSVSITLTGQTKKHILAAIEGIADRTAAEELRGKDLWIEKSALPVPDTGNAFYIDDLIGLKAYNEDGAFVGDIIDVDNFGAGDLLEIKPADKDSFYLLFSEETVPEINMEDRAVRVEIPEMY